MRETWKERKTNSDHRKSDCSAMQKSVKSVRSSVSDVLIEMLCYWLSPPTRFQSYNWALWHCATGAVVKYVSIVLQLK